jgi:hypothetical protein
MQLQEVEQLLARRVQTCSPGTSQRRMTDNRGAINTVPARSLDPSLCSNAAAARCRQDSTGSAASSSGHAGVAARGSRSEWAERMAAASA